VQREPTRAALRYNLATALVATGDLAAAEGEIEACLALDPHNWRAHMTAAQLRRQTAESNHLERLSSLLPALEGAGQAARICVHMALAKEYEDLGRYAEAFSHLRTAKSAGGENRSYTWTDDQALFQSIIESFPAPEPRSGGYPTEEPIFVIGMPRTGTTLVERILSSHPDVHPAGELLNFPLSVKAASGSRSPRLIDVDTIVRSRVLDWRSLGEAYLSSTRPVTGHTARFVDKLPHNFLYAGHIARALPGARIICLRRHPLDTCLSNFRQLFAPQSKEFEYSYDLLDTGRYFVLFDQLMTHWRKVLPGRVLEVEYESLVQAQEPTSRQMIEFCGLDWNEACLRFEHNPMPVATASAVQVRAPMYGSAVHRWRKYETQLRPLIDLLAASGIAVDA
jgi:tetratricopeptide (TPR) repeat protein